MNEMKTVIVYHNADLDGHCSGYIAGLAHPGSQFIGINYGDEIPWKYLEDAHVIMTDFSFQPWEMMKELADVAAKVTWIDHHKSAIDLWEKDRSEAMSNWAVVLSTRHAACELAWNYFFNSMMLPRSVWLLGRYDIWDLEADADVLPFQWGMRMLDTDPAYPSIWPALFSRSGSLPEYTVMDDTVANGRLILKYQTDQNRMIMKNAFEITFEDHKFLAVNAGGINSLAFKSVYDADKHDAVMSFYLRPGGKWTFSMYSPDQSLDVSKIAIQRGGGGHPYACGFQTDNLKSVIEKTND